MNIAIDCWQLLKQMSRNYRYTTYTVLVMTFGVSSALFVLMLAHATLNAKLPFFSEHQIRIIESVKNNAQYSINNLDYRLYQAIKNKNNMLEHISAFHTAPVSVESYQSKHKYLGVYGEPKMFTVAPVTPLEGKLFSYQHLSEHEKDVVIISEMVAQDYFGRTERVVGQFIEINSKRFQVLAVLPQRYKFPHATEIWLPLKPSYFFNDRIEKNSLEVSVFGRLSPRIEEQNVSIDFSDLVSQQAERFTDKYRNYEFKLATLQRAYLGKTGVEAVYLLQVLALALLVLTCTNVSVLLFSNIIKRQHEAAIRLITGASPFRLFRQIMLESVLICVASVGLTVLITMLATAGFSMMAPHTLETAMPFWWQFNFNTELMLTISSGVVAVMLIIGSFPAWKTVRASSFSSVSFRFFQSSNKASNILLVLEIGSH